MTDIITDFIERATKLCENFTPEIANELEKQMRNDWGGERVEYIAKTSSEEKRKRAAALEDVRRNRVKPNAAAKKHGISRSAMYRLLSK